MCKPVSCLFFPSILRTVLVGKVPLDEILDHPCQYLEISEEPSANHYLVLDNALQSLKASYSAGF